MSFFKNKKIFIRVISAVLVGIFAFSLSVTSFAESAENEDTGMVEKITVENGYFVNDFRPNTYYYDVYLESFTYNITVLVDLTDSRFEYTISGDDAITADTENIVTVSVFDPLGEYESVEYYLNIYVGLDSIEDVKWTGLSYLDVENGIFSPQFSRYRVTYYAILENSIDSFKAADVNYRTLNPDAEVEINCRGELNKDGTIPEGKRVEYTLTVTESDGKVKTYYLNLYRKAKETAAISDTAVLSNIKINGGEVKVSAFSSHRSYYDIKVPQSVTNLDIQAYPTDKSDIVKIVGPVAMNEDEPIFVNILVISPTEDTFSIYTMRLSYDSFVYTEKYTSFQLLVYVLLAGAVLFVLGFALCKILERKKKNGGSDDENVEEMPEITESVEDEDTTKV